MKIENIVIIPEIEDKLIWKHGVFRYEVEEAFENKPLFRFERKSYHPEEHIYSAMSVIDSGRFLAMFFI
ncbi:BrnT family toxin [candidate division KSB1 bacterium]|nr:BrnT family toxin [candidate division KSB1 bacterium]